MNEDKSVLLNEDKSVLLNVLLNKANLMVRTICAGIGQTIIVWGNKMSKISADTLGWMANIALHAATLPFLFALMSGLTDKTPPIDFVLMVWSALTLLFFRAVLLKDTLNILTIGLGFFIQATMLVLIFFK